MTRLGRCLTLVTCLVGIGLVSPGRSCSAVAQQASPRDASPRLSAILSRAARYTDEFTQQFLTVVAEERYEQKLGRQHRTLRSDLTLVRPAGADAWLPFRDVFEVDGKPVRDRDERVRRLFIDDPGTAVVAAQRIEEESARFSLAPLYRETMDPTLPLVFLDRRNQHRFAFTLKGEEQVEATRACRVDYRETVVPTIIQYGGIDAAASGSLWLEEQTGRLVKATVRALLRKGRGVARFELQVTFRRSDALGMWAPAELRERFEWSSSTLTGVATYTNFRRFATGARIVDPR